MSKISPKQRYLSLKSWLSTVRAKEIRKDKKKKKNRRKNK